MIGNSTPLEIRFSYEVYRTIAKGLCKQEEAMSVRLFVAVAAHLLMTEYLMRGLWLSSKAWERRGCLPLHLIAGPFVRRPQVCIEAKISRV